MEEGINFVLRGGLKRFVFIINYIWFHVYLIYIMLNFHFNIYFHFFPQTLLYGGSSVLFAHSMQPSAEQTADGQ